MTASVAIMAFKGRSRNQAGGAYRFFITRVSQNLGLGLTQFSFCLEPVIFVSAVQTAVRFPN